MSDSNKESFLSHLPLRTRTLAFFFALTVWVPAVSFGEMFDFSAVHIPTPAELKASDAQAEIDSSPVVCPQKDHIQQVCAAETYTPEQMFGGTKEFDPFTFDYRAAGKCKLWWWAEYARHFHYAPLSEWAEDVQDSLIERVDQKALYNALGLAPRPPYVGLNENGPPQEKCSLPTPGEESHLVDRLRHLNLRSLSQKSLDELLSHCMAFRVATAAWMSIGTRVVDSYVIPIGDINILIWARTHVGAVNLAMGSMEGVSDAAASSASGDIRYTAVGACPIDQDPRVCVEKYLSDLPPGSNQGVYGFKKGYDHTLNALPYRTDLDGFYMNRADEPKEIRFQVDDMGYMRFTRILDSDTRETLKITLYDGQLALVSSEIYCDPVNPRRKRLALVPLAFGDRLGDLQDDLGVYTPSDFPESQSHPTGMLQKGCGKPISYSEWAAQTANGLKHIAFHGLPSVDTLYRTAAAERFRRIVKDEGLRELNDSAVYGAWRKSYTDTAITNEAEEKIGVHFVIDPDGNGHTEGKEDASRVVYIDRVPATQVWYHYHSIPIWANAKDNIRAHIVVSHLKEFDALYEISMAKFNKVATRCAPEPEQKKLFMEGTYYLLNAAPLQAGSGAVAKAFLAALYANLFGKKLDAISSMDQIDFDAWTMPQTDFNDKYLSMILD